MSKYADSKFINKFTHFFDAWPLAQVSHNSIFLEDGSPWYQLSTDIVKYMWNDKTHPAERIKSRNVYGGAMCTCGYIRGAQCVHMTHYFGRAGSLQLFSSHFPARRTQCVHIRMFVNFDTGLKNNYLFGPVSWYYQEVGWFWDDFHTFSRITSRWHKFGIILGTF